jgi:hypothetical protein
VAKLEELEDLWGSEGLARRIGAGETTIVRAIGGLPLRPETCARIEEWVAKLP